MKADYVLLRFGELTLKGKNRSQFERKVMEHVQRVLQPFTGIHIEKTHDRIYIQLNGAPYDEIARQLQKVFGLASFSPVRKCGLDLQQIRETALAVMRELDPFPATFKVRVKRAYKLFAHTSQEMNHLVGSYILANSPGLKVDVHAPQVELRIEIREEGTFVFSEVTAALGGLPVGSSGKAMLMLSGGIDSPVAGWLSMKRGVQIEAVHFHSFPYTSERAQQKVVDLTRKLSAYAGPIQLHMVPFTDIQTRLNSSRRDSFLITLMRRAMVRITEKLAQERGALALVTGDSLGQVASQTLASMQVIGEVTRLPILRPLVAMDKKEIVELAKRIDTYSISILPYADCCTLFVPKAPSTNPNPRVVKNIEQSITELDRLLEEAVANTERIEITPEAGAADAPQLDHLF